MGRDPALRDAEQRSARAGSGCLGKVVGVGLGTIGVVGLLMVVGSLTGSGVAPQPSASQVAIAPSTAGPSATVTPDAARKEQAKAVDPREMVADPSAFVGVNLRLRGRAVNVQQQGNYTWVNLSAAVPNRSSTENLVVEVRPKDTKILSDECYQFFGVGAGTQQVTQVFTGAGKSAPLVNGYAWELIPTTASYASCQESPAPTPTVVVVPKVVASPPPTPIRQSQPQIIPTATPVPTVTTAVLPIVPGQVVGLIRGTAPMSFRIEAAYAAKTLPESAQSQRPAATAQGSFLIITGEVRNTGSTPGQIADPPFSVRDGRGHLSGSAPVAVQQLVKRLYGKVGAGDTVAAGTTAAVVLVYDVADVAAGVVILSPARP